LLFFCMLTQGVSLRKGHPPVPGASKLGPKPKVPSKIAPFPVTDTPGLRVLLGMNGIQVAGAPIQALVAKSFSDSSLPDVYGSAGSGIPGVDVDYHLYNIKVSGFAFRGKTSITLNPTTDQIIAVIQNIYCDLNMDWSYTTHPIPFSDSGSATDDLTFTINAALQLSNNGFGEPTLALRALNVDITQLNIHLHGGADWFYGIFVDAFHGQIEDAFRNAITSAIQKAVAALQAKFLTNMVVRMPIGYGLGIDYSFDNLGSVTNPYMRLFGGFSHHAGVFYLTDGKPVNCLGEPLYMISDIPSLTDIQVMLSDYTLNSLTCAIYTAGLLDIVINSTNAPKDFPIQFNTSVFSFILPQLYNAYPNDAFEIGIVPTQPISTAIIPTGIPVNITGNISIIVHPKTGGKVSVLTIYTQLMLVTEVELVGGNLTGSVTTASINLTVAETKVGPISPDVLKFFAQVAVAAGVPYINKAGAVGFPIPYLSSANIKLFGETIVYKFGHLTINSQYQLT